MAQPILDPFEALGLPRDASDQAIKSRYHDLARRYHPNRTIQAASAKAKATLSDHFHRVHEAWAVLSKPDDRRRRVELLHLLELQQSLEARLLDSSTPDAPSPEAEQSDQQQQQQQQ